MADRATSAQSRGSNFPALLEEYEQSREAGNKSNATSKDRSQTKAGLNKRKSSADRKRAEELEKEKQAHAATYQSWQAAKREVREEGHDVLRQKLTLQRQLVLAQEELGVALREEEEEQRREELEEERRIRAEESERLSKICRQSLKEDRVAKETSRDVKPSNPNDETKPERSPRERRRSPKAPGARFAAPVEESGEPVEEREPSPAEPLHLTDEELDSLPWHHVQLYQLYGRKADDYLHPKIEKKVDRGINPRLAYHMKRKENEQPDAGGLWLALREDSNVKLLKEDSTMSRELKETFGAFARQCLRHQRTTIQRNYNLEEDVPDLKILLDERLSRKARNTKHKVGVMYRSAQNNEDRAKILAFNNPIPDLNNLEGEESVQRYMPSWVGEEDTESEFSYKKWLPRVPGIDEKESEADLSPASPPPSAQSGRSSELLEEWAFMEKGPRKREKGPKLVFITERDTTVIGEFSKRRKELSDSKGIPEPAAVAPPVDNLRTKGTNNGDSQSHSAPATVRRPTWRASPWQPLSLGALMEYKEKMGALGEGDYHHGGTRMWSAITTYD